MILKCLPPVLVAISLFTAWLSPAYGQLSHDTVFTTPHGYERVLLKKSLERFKDTIVNKQQYNYMDYYLNGQLKSFGNYADSSKEGSWKYFRQNGNVLAYGNYENNLKTGKWIYFASDGEKRKIVWNARPSEDLKYDTDGDLEIYDRCSTPFSFEFFTNGRYCLHALKMITCEGLSEPGK